MQTSSKICGMILTTPRWLYYTDCNVCTISIHEDKVVTPLPKTRSVFVFLITATVQQCLRRPKAISNEPIPDNNIVALAPKMNDTVERYLDHSWILLEQKVLFNTHECLIFH